MNLPEAGCAGTVALRDFYGDLFGHTNPYGIYMRVRSTDAVGEFQRTAVVWQIIIPVGLLWTFTIWAFVRHWRRNKARK